jgi:hypothetical protein
MFDTPNYRQWFDGLAEFVPTYNPLKLSAHLRQLFGSEPHLVSEDEIQETKRRFNWKEIVDEFWNRLLHQ